MHIVTYIMLGLPVLVVVGCSTSAPKHRTALPTAPATESRPAGLFRIALEPEAGAVPAKLKDDDHHRVTGDYAYADLEAVLRLVGRVSHSYREVAQVRFFERIAASVTVADTPFSSTQILCSKDGDGVWQVVGLRDVN